MAQETQIQVWKEAPLRSVVEEPVELWRQGYGGGWGQAILKLKGHCAWEEDREAKTEGAR